MDCKTEPATGHEATTGGRHRGEHLSCPAGRGQVQPHICPHLPANLLMEARGGQWQ